MARFLYVCVSCVLFQLHLSLKSRSSVRSYQLSSDCGLWLIQEALVWHIWSTSMWLWMLTSADSTPLHLQLIAATVWIALYLSQTCVCACWILSFCTELTKQNYSSVWSYVVNKITVWRSNMLSWQKVVAQWAVQQHKSGKILLTKHGLLTAPSVTFNLSFFFFFFAPSFDFLNVFNTRF